MEEVLHALRSFDALRDDPLSQNHDVVHIRRTPGIAPDFASDEEVKRLPSDIQATVRKLGIDRLYKHQVQAMQLASEGKDVVLEAPTASGKTLCFALTMTRCLASDFSSHALMIYPMKAVANDQRRQVEEIVRSYPNQSRDIRSWLYDGDTDDPMRKLLRQEPPAILMTNPEMLHLSFLGHSQAWDRFLRGLRYVVVDEIHEYRGYFGTNLALLLRRFLLMLHRLGSHPQLFLATATCANPVEHARNLTGREFNLVNTGNRMGAPRSYAFVRPRIPDFQFREIYRLRVARAALACLSKELSTIVFCPTRKFTEEILRTARRDAPHFGLDPKCIAPYRAGYSPEARRDIEEGLRGGRYKIVFCTNALELGIDIGHLDACVLAGFPDSVMSAWQRIGRAGRHWDKMAYVLFYAINNAFDEFYAENIDAFLTKPLDEITIGLDNEEVIAKHTPYLLHEVGWQLEEEDKPILSEAFWEHSSKKAQGGTPIAGGRGPHYGMLDLRGSPGGTYKLLDNGDEIGSISDAQCFQEAYVGAIYNHMGKAYEVVGHGAQEVFLQPASSHLRTEPSFFWVAQSSAIINGERYGRSLGVHHGKLTIFQNFAGYTLINDMTGAVLDEKRAELARRHYAHAFWMTLEDDQIGSGIDLAAAIRSLEHLFRIGSAFVIPCDRHDTSTFSSTTRPIAIYFYENVPGGIGVASKAFELWPAVLAQGVSIAQKCSCEDGCPRCICPPRWKAAKGLSKAAGIRLARNILEVAKKTAEEKFDPETYGWTPQSGAPPREVPSLRFRPDEVESITPPEPPTAATISEPEPAGAGHGLNALEVVERFQELCRTQIAVLEGCRQAESGTPSQSEIDRIEGNTTRLTRIGESFGTLCREALDLGLNERARSLLQRMDTNARNPLSWDEAIEALELCMDFGRKRTPPPGPANVVGPVEPSKLPLPRGRPTRPEDIILRRPKKRVTKKVANVPPPKRRRRSERDTPTVEDKLEPLADAILEILQANRGKCLTCGELFQFLPTSAADVVRDPKIRQAYVSVAVSILRERGHPIPKGRYVLPP